MTTIPIPCRPDGNLVGWWVKVPLLGYGSVVSHSLTDISVEFVGRREPVNYPLTSEFEVVPLLKWVHLLADGTIPTSPRHRALAGRMLKMNPASERFWNGVLCLQKLGARSGSFILSYQAHGLEKIEHAKVRELLIGGKRVMPKPSCKKLADGDTLTEKGYKQFRYAMTPGHGQGLNKKLAIENFELGDMDAEAWEKKHSAAVMKELKQGAWKRNGSYVTAVRLRIKWVPERSDYIRPAERELAKIATLLEEGHQVKAIAAALRMPLSTARRRINYLLSWPDVAKENGAKELENPSIEGRRYLLPSRWVYELISFRAFRLHRKMARRRREVRV